MNELKIATRNDVTAFQPGQEISGAAGWKLDKKVDWIEIRLFWYTDGKGTEDVQVVDTIRFDNPLQEAAEPYRLVAPDFPYSFSGTLISLMWAIEIVLASGSDAARVDLVIAPKAEEIKLTPHAGP